MDTMDFAEELQYLRGVYSQRDHRMRRIAMARTPGGLTAVFPDMFPSEGPYTEPMVANMIDVAARDTAEVLAPPPTLSCASSIHTSDAARRFAEKRTKVAYGYFDASNMSVSLMSMADQYVTYGFSVGVVRPDYDRQIPVIRFLDPRNCYPVFDRWDRTEVLYEVRFMARRQAMIEFPALAERMHRDGTAGLDGRVEIVRRMAPEGDVLFTPAYPEVLLREAPNPLGVSVAHVFRRPGLTEEMIGQFDDVLAVQVAKARFALLTLEAAQKAVQAPIAMPIDVQEMNIGPDATLRSQRPESIQRVRLDVPREAFAQQANLDQELRQGSRYPDVRTGNTDASIVTGRGVQALMTGFDSHIKAGQSVFAHGLSVLFGTAFRMDEALWPDVERTMRGNANGTPYEVRYKPSRDIRGDYSIDVQYGLMAGLQPNQALVFGLQARGDKLISRDFLRKQMPFSMDANQEDSQVDVEDLRDALKAAVAALAQAIPAMAGQGQDPTMLLQQMSDVITARQKGVPVEMAISKAFAPPEQPEQPEAQQSMDPMAQMEAEMAAAAGGGMPPGGGGPMAGAGPMGGGMPAPEQPVLGLLAQLGTGGQAGLGAQVVRKRPF